jgi:DNA polymerase I-like protein with 3'-5' exonuclease and polymerase domains
MKTLIFDIESDGLLDKTKTIHCLVIHELETGETVRYNHQPSGRPVQEGVDRLLNCTRDECIVGHNILGFDIPVIDKLYGRVPNCEIIDTIVCTRLMWPDLKEVDFGRINSHPNFPKNLIGSHSLKAWGHRIGMLKGDFKEADGDFSVWSPSMEDYCVQDVAVTAKLYQMIIKKNYSVKAIKLEHGFAGIIGLQERHGFLFDKEKANGLYVTLAKRRIELEAEMRRVFVPNVEKMKTCTYLFEGQTYNTKAEATVAAKAWAKANKTTQKLALEKIKDGKAKEKEIPFNPGSREEIAERFVTKYGWKPAEFTPDGKPKVDEAVLSALDRLGYAEAKPLLEYLLIQKRIGQLAEGKEAWMKMVKEDGRIHGRVTTNGAVTGRCTHSKPNMAQVPRVGSEYGKECRELFTVPSGKRLVGCDASGLELRCLAHFMARFDDGAYANELTKGDIHTVNQRAAGLPTRDNAKTFIYAFLYGAGDEKIGNIIGKGQEEGRRIKQEFLNKTPALKRLREEVERAVRAKGHLLGLDGRQLPIRSQHAALNTLLQSAGALVMKMATIHFVVKMDSLGHKFGEDYAIVAHIHDEMQIEANEAIADEVGKIGVEAIRDAGKSFNFRCPLDGEYRIGLNWAETH